MGKGFSGQWLMKKGSAFLPRVLQKCTGVERQRKRRLKRLFENWMPITFVKGNYFGTPLCTTCKSNEVGDKDRARETGGGAGEGGGEGQIQGVKG